MMECSNYLKIEGNKEDIERFVSQTRKGGLLESFIPLPAEYGHTDEGARPKEVDALLIMKYGFDNLDEWCLSNWGTLYPDVDLSYDEQTYSFNFTTGRPPVIAIIRISILYPDLKILFEYKTDEEDADEVLGKWGKYIIKDGWVDHEEYEKQNEGELALWIEHIHEKDRELRESIQKANVRR